MGRSEEASSSSPGLAALSERMMLASASRQGLTSIALLYSATHAGDSFYWLLNNIVDEAEIEKIMGFRGPFFAMREGTSRRTSSQRSLACFVGEFLTTTAAIAPCRRPVSSGVC
jgi:hypothetical protein